MDSAYPSARPSRLHTQSPIDVQGPQQGGPAQPPGTGSLVACPIPVTPWETLGLAGWPAPVMGREVTVPTPRPSGNVPSRSLSLGSACEEEFTLDVAVN